MGWIESFENLACPDALLIKESEPKALTKLGLDPNHWSAKVKGIGHGYWRVVAEVEDLLDLAAQFKQRTLYGIGFARKLIGV